MRKQETAFWAFFLFLLVGCPWPMVEMQHKCLVPQFTFSKFSTPGAIGYHIDLQTPPPPNLISRNPVSAPELNENKI